jgi:hypothetical protein
MPRTRDNKLAEDRRARKQSGVGKQKRDASQARRQRPAPRRPPHRDNTQGPVPTTDLQKVPK